MNARRPALASGACAALVLALAACGDTHEPGGDAETRARMRDLFESMRALLPVAADAGELGDPRNAAWAADALDTLARNAFALARHAGGDPGYRNLGDSLARDAADARRFLAEGRAEASAFLILQTTDHCVACHSKLPSAGDSPLAEQFVETSRLATLPLEERAALQVATRRFDDALASYERLLGAPDQPPAGLLRALTGYLVVCLRVKSDFERPRRTLERFAEREDLWTNLRAEVRAWVAALPELAAVQEREPSIEEARALLREAQRRLRFPDDRRALPHYITASGVLLRWVEGRRATGETQGEELAEAYYLLGLAESHLARDTWASETPSYLEAAIRLAPQGRYAARAYALLEEEIVLGYTGSGGTRIPDDVEARLRELRDLTQTL